MAKWELPFVATAQHDERVCYHMLVAWERSKFKIPSKVSTVYCFHPFIRSKNCKLCYHKSGTICTWYKEVSTIWPRNSKNTIITSTTTIRAEWTVHWKMMVQVALSELVTITGKKKEKYFLQSFLKFFLTNIISFVFVVCSTLILKVNKDKSSNTLAHLSTLKFFMRQKFRTKSNQSIPIIFSYWVCYLRTENIPWANCPPRD